MVKWAKRFLDGLFFCCFCKIQSVVFWCLMGMGFDGSLSKELALQGQGQGPSFISWVHEKGMCWLVCSYNPIDGEAETMGSWESCSALLVSYWPPAKILSQKKTVFLRVAPVFLIWTYTSCISICTKHTHTHMHARIRSCMHKHTRLKYAFHETSLYFSSKEAECQFFNMYIHKKLLILFENWNRFH